MLSFRRCISSSSLKKHYDIIVSGGGMIGTALSCLLAQTKVLSAYNVLLIEPSKAKEWAFKPLYSNRVSSLNKRTKKLMEKIGAWDHISNIRFKPVTNMKVWDSAGAKLKFENNTGEPVAYMVENDIIIEAVERELRKLTNVEVVRGRGVEQYQLPRDTSQPVQVQLQDGSFITCSLLVGADGANSQVRRAMDVQFLSWAYAQTAVVATIRLAQDSQNDTAWQRFLMTGPVALLPLTDNLSSLVWSTSPQEAKNLLNMPNDIFVDALNDALWKGVVQQHEAVKTVSSVTRRLLGLIDPQVGVDDHTTQPPTVTAVEDNSRATFPLAFGHAVSYVTPSVALVGDAAHKVHPLAGQGVNLGYGDVTSLVSHLSEAVQLGKPLGDVRTLRSYEKERQSHNLPMMAVIELMVRLYSTQNPLLLAAGHAAIQLANSVHPIKTLMMNRAAA